jgi:hypothetical protein
MVMAAFLDWYASHNSLIIQSLAALIALLIVFFIFRLFFTEQATDSSVSGKSVTYTQLEDKLNKLLDQQAQMKASISNVMQAPQVEALDAAVIGALSGDPAATQTNVTGAGANAAAAAQGSPEQVAELARLRTEITTLKESLSKREIEISAAKEAAQSGVKLDDLSGKLTEYEKEIELLKSRLSDYEIISEDIADLQKYKKENQELKSQLAQAPAVESAVKAEAQSEPEPTSEPVVEPELMPEPDSTIKDSSELPEAVVASELESDEAKEMSKDVKKEEKVLLDDFEKHFAKDED